MRRLAQPSVRSLTQFSAAQLVAAVTARLVALRVPRADAEIVADSLVEAELEDHGSHGLLRLPAMVERLQAGQINPEPAMRVLAGRPATALLDADNGLGPLAGVRAVELAADRARAAGAGVVAVRRSNHLGALGYYVRRLAGRGFVGLAFTNSPPAMAPPGGRVPFLGTNPIAAAFPTTADPVVVDLATSQVARGRIRMAARTGEAIPEGWALGGAWTPTTDAGEAMAGLLLPLGGYKGFALALLVELLGGVLGAEGAAPDACRPVPGTHGGDVGHCFVAIDPGGLAPGFAERSSRVADELRALGGRVPGEHRLVERARRLAAGIDLPGELVADLRERAGVAL
jgi:(2R)-3-sulfolactate dehydrogenase (NADP+)